MQSYTDFNILNPYSSDEDGKLWSSFIQQPTGGAYGGFETPLYPNSIFSVSPVTSTLPHEPIVVDYNPMSSPDFAPFQDLIGRRKWCLTNLRLSTKEAAALQQENVNLQKVNSELNKQLSHLQLQNATMFPSGNSIVNCFERMTNGEKGTTVTDKRAARGAENVDPVKKTDTDRVKLPKSISIRSNGYLKTVQPGDGSVSRSRAVDRVKPASDMQKVYVRGKEEKQPLELKVYNQGMTKTELCNKWQQTGLCPYGDHCQFAHGIEELRPVIRHPRYKTEVCRMVLAGDPCPYGHRCHFRHALSEEEKVKSRQTRS